MEWISKISNLFIRPKAIYLVRDDDNILNNAEVRDKLLASGYEVMDFDDSILDMNMTLNIDSIVRKYC